MAGRLLPAAAAEGPDAVCDEIRMIIQQYRIAGFLSLGVSKI